MDTRKKQKIDEVSLARSVRLMFRAFEDRKIIYLAISKRNFQVLVFTLAVGIMANIALVDLLLRAPTMVVRTNIFIYITQLAISIISIAAGLWLFFKGINIIFDDNKVG